MDNFPLWIDHILAILLGVVVPASSARSYAKNSFPTVLTSLQKKDFYISTSVSLFIMAFIVMLCWLLFKRIPEDIGLQRPYDEGQGYWWAALLFIILYIADTLYSVSSPSQIQKAIEESKKRTPFMPTSSSEFRVYLLMCFSAGVFEEIVYRGFFVTYSYYLFSGLPNTWLWAIFLPSAIFSIAHYYQGTKAVIKILVFSLLFGYYFIRSGSLLICMLLHFLVNVTGGFLTLWFSKKKLIDL